MIVSSHKKLRIKKQAHSALLLLSVLLMPVFVAYVWLPLEKQQIKAVVGSMLRRDFPENELIWLKFTKQEAKIRLKWEHDAEFLFEQRMYDVAQIIETKDSIILQCWFDSRETKINNLLAEILVQQPLTSQQKNTFRLILLKLMITMILDYDTEMSHFAKQSILSYPISPEMCIFRNFPPNIPPPRS